MLHNGDCGNVTVGNDQNHKIKNVNNLEVLQRGVLGYDCDPNDIDDNDVGGLLLILDRRVVWTGIPKWGIPKVIMTSSTTWTCVVQV